MGFIGFGKIGAFGKFSGQFVNDAKAEFTVDIRFHRNQIKITD